MTYYEMGYYKQSYKQFVDYLDNYPNGMRRQTVDVWAESALNNIDYSIAVDTENKKVTNCCGSKEVEEMILKTLKGE